VSPSVHIIFLLIISTPSDNYYLSLVWMYVDILEVIVVGGSNIVLILLAFYGSLLPIMYCMTNIKMFGGCIE
jgi:hypothetical protein